MTATIHTGGGIAGAAEPKEISQFARTPQEREDRARAVWALGGKEGKERQLHNAVLSNRGRAQLNS